MSAELGIAAGTCFFLAFGHTRVGLRWALPRLRDARLDGTAASRMLRFSWHVVTVQLVAFGCLLTTLAVDPHADARTAVLRWLAASWLFSTALVVWMNRRHLRGFLRLPVPVFFLLIAVMCWLASA
jgi:hypothetical protein